MAEKRGLLRKKVGNRMMTKVEATRVIRSEIGVSNKKQGDVLKAFPELKSILRKRVTDKK